MAKKDSPTARALREWREDYPARVAAKALGVSYYTYVGWEQGRAPGASLEAVLTRAMLTQIDEMLEKMRVDPE